MEEKIEILPNATYTTQEAKKFLGVGDWSMWQLAKKQLLHPQRVGRRYIFLGSDLLRFLTK